MVLQHQPKRGQEIIYEKDIMFKGTELVTVKIVAVTDREILLENGDRFFYVVNRK